MTCFTAPLGPSVQADEAAVLAVPTIGAPRVALPARAEATIADDPIRVPRRRRARRRDLGMLTSETLGPRRRGPPGAATPRPRIAMPAGRDWGARRSAAAVCSDRADPALRSG